MFVLGYGEKQSKNDKNNFEIPNLLSCEWGNPADNGDGKIQNAILRF